MTKLLKRKEELNAETVMLNKLLIGIEDKITRYSQTDMIVVHDLVVLKTELESVFLDVLNESNDLWLQSIKKSDKRAV